MMLMLGVLNAMTVQNGGFCGPEQRSVTRIASDLRHMFGPDRTFVATAANGGSEPRLQDAAGRPKVSYELEAVLLGTSATFFRKGLKCVLVHAFDQCFAGFLGFTLAFDQVFRPPPRQQGKFNEFFHDIDHVIAIGRWLHPVIIVEFQKRLGR